MNTKNYSLDIHSFTRDELMRLLVWAQRGQGPFTVYDIETELNRRAALQSHQKGN